MVFAYGGFAIAMKCPQPGGGFLATAITCIISLQAFLNLGVVSGLLPSKGVNLPFFSQGGTSLVTNIWGLSILLNIGGQIDEKESDFECRRDRRTSLSGPKFGSSSL
jgi:cell division protein FtsW